MAELFNKEGEPVGEVFDVDGNPIDETLTPDEVDIKVDEAKDKASGEYEIQVKELQTELGEKEDSLKQAEESLGKEQEKDKNFGRLRGTTEEKEKEAASLRTEVKDLRDKVEAIGVATKTQPVNAIIKELSGDDEELGKKIKFHYDSFITPENDTEELQKERINSAHLLAGGKQDANLLSGGVVSSGGGVTPGIKEPENKGKLEDSSASDVGEKLGLSKEHQRRNKLI